MVPASSIGRYKGEKVWTERPGVYHSQLAVALITVAAFKLKGEALKNRPIGHNPIHRRNPRARQRWKRSV